MLAGGVCGRVNRATTGQWRLLQAQTAHSRVPTQRVLSGGTWRGGKSRRENLRCRLTAMFSRVYDGIAWPGAVSRAGREHSDSTGRRVAKGSMESLLQTERTRRTACRCEAVDAMDRSEHGDVAVQLWRDARRTRPKHAPQRVRRRAAV
jgi:hypothetical protein